MAIKNSLNKELLIDDFKNVHLITPYEKAFTKGVEIYYLIFCNLKIGKITYEFIDGKFSSFFQPFDDDEQINKQVRGIKFSQTKTKPIVLTFDNKRALDLGITAPFS